MSEEKTVKEIKEINIALLGLGTVGMGVYKLVQRRKNELPRKIGCCVKVKKILVRNAYKIRDGVDNDLITDSWDEILSDDSIDIVVEVMGGLEPAGTYIRQALEAGKNVVTANKDLIAEQGHELLVMAEEKHCDLLYEASVGGGIPVLRTLKQCLTGNNIDMVLGIVNGTTNYILTRMTEDGMEFDEALAKATDLGYAEADPTSDIEGYDAGRKLAIMASIAFNSVVTFKDVHTEGITRITSTDIRYADAMDCVIKLLAVGKQEEGQVSANVYPMLVPKNHPLASVNDSFNAVFVHGDAVDDAMFYGRGAGELPTASAVMGDVIDISRNLLQNCTGRVGSTCYRNLPIKPLGEVKNCYFFRLQVEDMPGTLASISSVFSKHNVSIKQVIQKPAKKHGSELVVVTDFVKENDFAKTLDELRTMEMVYEISSVIRVYA